MVVRLAPGRLVGTSGKSTQRQRLDPWRREGAAECATRAATRRIAWGILLVAGFAGCATPASTSPPAGVRMPTACLAQVRAEHIQIRTVDELYDERVIPAIREVAPVFQGRLAQDGSLVAGRAQTGFVGLRLDGRLLWLVKETSMSALPAISADARKVAFTDRHGDLVLYDVETAAFSKIGRRGRNPSWSFTGKRLAYDDGAQVSVYVVDSGTSFVVGQGTEPSWLPDETSVAVRANAEQIDILSTQTRARRVLLDASSSISVPRWTPDGEWMTYTRGGPRHWWSRAAWTGAEPSQILIRHAKSGWETSVGEYYKADPGDFTWVLNSDLCRSQPKANS